MYFSVIAIQKKFILTRHRLFLRSRGVKVNYAKENKIHNGSAPTLVAPAFLKELLQARSPSGYEDEAREVVRKRMARVADSFEVDALGSCHATLGTKVRPLSCSPDISTSLA